MGSAGLKWLLEVLATLRTPHINPQGFIQHFRDGYRALEVSGMKNDRGCYIEISEFHSGSQQGGIRVPEGRRGAGWAFFERELRRYFLSGNSSPTAVSSMGRTLPKKLGDRKISGRKHDLGKSIACEIAGGNRDLGKGLDSGYVSKWVEKHRFPLVADAPRPTRRCDFIWKSLNKTLRISRNEDGSRVVKWASLAGPSNKAIETTVRTEQKGDPQTSTKTSKQDPPPSPEVVQQISSVGIYEDKSLSGDEDEKYPTTPLAQSLSDGEESEEAEMLSEKGEGSEKGLVTFNGLDMEVSALDELGFKDKERDTGPLLLGSSVEIGSPVTPLPVISVKSPDTVQRPITCEPLARIDPVGFAEFTAQYSGDVFALEEAMSVWVEQTYKSFGKLVGMPIVEFESEVIALLRRIDTERKKIRLESRPRRPPSSTRKGTRELRNLISTINYEGKKVASIC